MKFCDATCRSLIRRGQDSALVVGIAGGRVPYQPGAEWLYSLRILLLVCKVEILWTTGESGTCA